MIDRTRLDLLSDEFQSTFSIVREDPDVIANMMAPHEVPHVVSLIENILGWEIVSYSDTGQLNPDYDVYMFSRGTPEPKSARSDE